MKCIHCENELPNAVGFAKEMPDGTIRRGKLACCLSGCISHGLNSRSQQFRIIVMGDTKEDIDRRTAEKIRKCVRHLKNVVFHRATIIPHHEKP